MNKQELRAHLKANGIKQWQVAEKMGIQESNLSRKLRRDLSEVDEMRVKAAIAEILLERGDTI